MLRIFETHDATQLIMRFKKWSEGDELMYYHRVFKKEIDGRFIVLIPTLNKLLELKEENFHNIPSFITTEIPIPESRWQNLKDFEFLGTNLILTDKCNLCCGYCYESSRPRKLFTIMKKEIVISAIDFIATIAQRLNAPRFYANMFGGEPTQAFELIQVALERMTENSKATGISKRATITTNGVMEKEKLFWLMTHMDAINISCDGYKEIHNSQRSGSFSTVFRTAKTVFDLSPKKLSLRTTVSKFSVSTLPDIVHFFGENFPGVRIFIEPVFAIGRGKKEKFGMPSHNEFFEAFLASIPIASRYGNKLKTSILNVGAKSRQFCGVPGNNFMVTPMGTVTVCNRMVFGNEPAQDRFTYGYFKESEGLFVFDTQKYQWLKQLTTDNIPECVDCFASSNCRGDCAANKAVIDSDNFYRRRSYRCEEIQNFIGKVMLYILDHGDDSISWRE